MTVQKNGLTNAAEKGLIHQLLGGKGVEVPPKVAQKPFRCRHRFALVCRKLVKVSASRKEAGANRSGYVLVQTCRYCGCFRSSMFSFREVGGAISIDSQIKFIDSGAGQNSLVFELLGEV